MLDGLTARATLRCVLLVVCALSASLFGVQNSSNKKAKSTRSAQNSKKGPIAPEKPEVLSVPETIKLTSGELIPVAEIVPRTEAAQKQLQDSLVKLRSAEIDPLVAALNDLNHKVDASLKDTQETVKLARSPLQLAEPRIDWARDRSDLEAINTNAGVNSVTIEDLRQQTRVLRETWSGIASAAVAAKLPSELMQRIDAVQTAADTTRGALREESDQLIQLQVQLSDTRGKIVGMIQQIDAADTALRNQAFVLDSPPIWFAWRNFNPAATKHQLQIYFAAAKARSGTYLNPRRFKLLLYGVLCLALLAVVIRLCNTDLSGAETGVDPSYLSCLQHPIAITALLSLLLFGVLFRKAPSDVMGPLRLLTMVPIIWIAFSFADRRLRPFLLGIGVFYVVDIVTLQLIAGTLLRRLIIFGLTGVLFVGMGYLLRRRGLLRTFFLEKHFTVMHICSYVAMLLLFLATVSNIVGNVTMADWLTNGTIVSMYWAIGFYVVCAVFIAITVATTASGLARLSRALRLHSALINRKLALYLKILGWALWIFAVLVSFQISTEALNTSKEVLYYKWKLGSISLSPFDIVMFGLVLLVSSMIARFTRFMLNEEVLPRTAINSGVAQAGSRLTYTGMLIVGVILALGAAGLELSKLTMLTGAFGVGLGFGLQNVVSNFVSGIIISLERPMKIGDLIEAGTILGEVTSIGFRSSTVRTFDGADVIVPNSEFITKSFVNWSLKDKLRRADILVGVAYGTDPNRVLEILTRIVSSHPGVLRTVSPLITFDRFGDSSLNFTVRFWARLDTWLQIRSELNVQINDEFAKNGIVIPFPQRDVNLKLEGSGLALPTTARSVAAASS